MRCYTGHKYLSLTTIPSYHATGRTVVAGVDRQEQVERQEQDPNVYQEGGSGAEGGAPLIYASNKLCCQSTGHGEAARVCCRGAHRLLCCGHRGAAFPQEEGDAALSPYCCCRSADRGTRCLPCCVHRDSVLPKAADSSTASSPCCFCRSAVLC